MEWNGHEMNSLLYNLFDYDTLILMTSAGAKADAVCPFSLVCKHTLSFSHCMVRYFEIRHFYFSRSFHYLSHIDIRSWLTKPCPILVVNHIRHNMNGPVVSSSLPCTLVNVLASQPATTRGQSYHLDADPVKNKLIYTSGRNVYIRDLKASMQSEYCHD